MSQFLINKRITSREELSVNKYLQDISKEPLLSPEEEVELSKKIKHDDKEAFEKLIRSNLRFVVSVAKQYQHQGLSLPDLINEGNLGLIKAARRFDETKGFKFITYAVWWIRHAILQALAEQGRIIRLPVNKVNALQKIHKTFFSLQQLHEREPSLQEIIQNLTLSPAEIKEAWKYFDKPLSMEAPLNEGEEDNMYDVIECNTIPPPDENFNRNSLNQEIENALSSLTEKEATIIRLFYGIGTTHPYSLKRIGEKYNLTTERVRQIKTTAIKKLRKSGRSKVLKSYLI